MAVVVAAAGAVTHVAVGLLQWACCSGHVAVGMLPWACCSGHVACYIKYEYNKNIKSTHTFF